MPVDGERYSVDELLTVLELDQSLSVESLVRYLRATDWTDVEAGKEVFYWCETDHRDWYDELATQCDPADMEWLSVLAYAQVNAESADEVDAAMLGNPVVPETVKEFIRTHGVAARIARLKQPDLGEEELRELAADRSFLIRYFVAGRRDLPTDLLEDFAHDRSGAVRQVIVERADCPPTC